VIALVGQSVVDRVKAPGRPWTERLGGSPWFAGQALAATGAPAAILTRGATPALRRPLHRLGLPVIVGPGRRSCVSVLRLASDGSRADEVGGFGEPFTPSDVAGWMAPALAGARAVVCGAIARDDFPPETLAALGRERRPVYLDGQGPLRARELGPQRLVGPLGPELLRHVTVLKLAEPEAEVALGGVRADAARALGVPIVVVTLAHRGAVLLEGGRCTPIAGDPVLGLADTVGAGDAFLALMASAMAAGAPAAVAARLACLEVAALLRRRLATGAASPGASEREASRRLDAGPARGAARDGTPARPRAGAATRR